MTVTYHAGRRIQGTQADFDGTPAVSGGWKELARTTLGSTQTTIDVASLDDKRYLMVLIDGQIAGSTNSAYILNNSTSGYATRKNYNGGTDNVSDVNFSLARTNGWGQALPEFNVMYMANKVNKEKLIINQGVGQSTAGAGTAPTRSEIVTKWTGTDVIDQITAVDYNNSGSGYASGSEVVVLGYDPDDTHTTNFWEELATATISSAGELDTGSFTAKKYLWIQYSCNSTDGGFGFRFNSDTVTNYARRFSQNGASDQTELSYNMMRMIWSGANTYYGNMFIINNSANEKLVINHQAGITATGAGTSPYRWETAGKWANTSSQITSVQFLDHADASGFIDSGTVKVWGSN